MKKIIIIALMLILGFPGMTLAAGESVSIEYYQVTLPDYFYPSTFDNLVLDFMVLPETTDTLKDLVVKNDGSARYIYEISKLVLWEDAGMPGFQGFAVDNPVGEAEYFNGNWVFTNVNSAITSAGKRYFVSVETRKNGTAAKSFQFAIPVYNDANLNGRYDAGDEGIFLDSGLGFPMTKVTSEKGVAFKDYLMDIHAPVSVITNLKQGQVIDKNYFSILGASKDQGYSVMTVELCVDDVCHAVPENNNNYLTWQYDWTAISDGVHIVYAKATDVNQNSAESERYTVSVETTPVVVIPPVTPPTDNPPATAIDYTVGRWVKLADQKAVYFLDSSNTRHAYPTEKVWKSYWGNDFSKVTTISATEMASFELGRNVPFKEGTLMKIPSVPKVYYVYNNAVIGWVKSENAANVHFGAGWAKTVVDLPESFFTDYSTTGPDIDAQIYLDAN